MKMKLADLPLGPAPLLKPLSPALPSPELAKEVACSVSQDVPSTAPGPQSPPDPHILSLERLRALCPKTWTPTDDHVRWVQAYICAPPGTSMAQVSRNLDIPPGRVRGWLCDRPEMRPWLQAALMASMNPGRIWQALELRALSGSDRAAHMCLMRYDPAYAAVHRSGPPSRKKPSDKDLEQAAQVAQAALDEAKDGA